MSNIETKPISFLGKNAESFAHHIQLGLEFVGIDMSNFTPCVMTHKDGDKIGFGICQIENDPKTFCCCFEDGLSFGENENSMPINKKQKATELAVLILSAILTKQPVNVPQCPECSE